MTLVLVVILILLVGQMLLTAYAVFIRYEPETSSVVNQPSIHVEVPAKELLEEIERALDYKLKELGIVPGTSSQGGS